MNPIRILVDSLADAGLPNAQMTNAREIICRLNANRFQVSVFRQGEVDPLILNRPNTRLIALPLRLQTLRILREFVWGKHEILFYLKSAPASKLYLGMRRTWRDDGRVVIGTIESQSDLRNEPTLAPEAIRLWEETVLRSDYLFSNSRGVQQSLEAEYGLKSEVVPTGVDTKFFTPHWDRKPNPRLRVLFVGSLRPFKQPQLLLDAATRFSGADFILAGEGLMMEQLRSRIEREPISNVQLLGFQAPNSLRSHYRQADVFLFPSAWEGSPKVILEAAASGLPVIVRDAYRPETVINGQTGYIAASDEELYRRLGQLLSDGELRRTFGIAGRKHSEQFDWDHITRQWEEIFVRLRPKNGCRKSA